MKTKIFIIGTTACFLLSGCLLTRTQVEQAEKDRKFQEQVNSMQRERADQVDQLNELNEQIRQLSGRLEMFENELKTSNEAKKVAEEKNIEKDQKLQSLLDSNAKLEDEIKNLRTEIAAKSQAAAAAQDEKNEKKQNAFQVAEGFFKQEDWKEAILNYQKYNDKNPKGKFVPDATYKMGVCFQELGMSDEAKTFYEEVITKFPNTEIAKSAKYRLKKLK